MLRVCFAECLPWQYAFKCFLTLGTALHMLINMSHTTHYQTYMHPHAHTDTHKHIHSPVQIFARTLWSCEVKRYSQSASAVLCFALCSHVHPPPFHLVTAYLSACLSVPIVSHLFPQLPSSLLISFLLIFFHIASYSLSTSKFVLTQVVLQVQCFEGIWVFRVRNNHQQHEKKGKHTYIWKKGQTINRSSHLKHTDDFLYEVSLSNLRGINIKTEVKTILTVEKWEGNFAKKKECEDLHSVIL